MPTSTTFLLASQAINDRLQRRMVPSLAALWLGWVIKRGVKFVRHMGNVQALWGAKCSRLAGTLGVSGAHVLKAAPLKMPRCRL